MSIIVFPELFEVELLMKKYGIKENDIDKQLVKLAITEIRKTHGVFQERHFKAVVQLLAHDWLPTDIPVLLPPPTAELYR